MVQSFILRTSVRYLRWYLVFFSFYIFYRGHNAPGGGFVGGLLFATAFILYAMSEGTEKARKALRMAPELYAGIGLLIAAASGIPPIFSGLPYFKGNWAVIELPLLGEVHFGTPMLFDLGVFFVVFGVFIAIIYALIEE